MIAKRYHNIPQGYIMWRKPYIISKIYHIALWQYIISNLKARQVRLHLPGWFMGIICS